jgi:hypothetical protein
MSTRNHFIPHYTLGQTIAQKLKAEILRGWAFAPSPPAPRPAARPAGTKEANNA